MLERIMGAIRLDAATYQEIDQDDAATGQAIVVAVLAALVGGIRSIGDREVLGEVVEGSFGGWLSSAIIGAPIGLFVGAGILLVVGKIFKGQAEYMGLVRTLGFASAPNALGFVPVIGGLASLWTLVCGVVAVRESHGLSTGQAVITVIIPAIVIGVIVLALALLVGVALFGALSGLAG